MSLLDLPIGARARIVGLYGGTNSIRRIMAMGLKRGDEVEILYKAVFGGPILVKNLSNGSQIAIGRGMAGKIMVIPL